MSDATLPGTTAPMPRLQALDVFRGLTIAAMILVNNPGSWAAIYPPFEHAPWHGCTPTDLIFPFFMFIVGVAIVLALGRRVEAGAPRGPLVHKAIRRGLLIVVIGIGLNAYPRIVPWGLLGLVGLDATVFADAWSTLRFPGVLQRIGVAYTIVSILFLYLSPRALRRLTVVLLLGYWALITLVPVPGVAVVDLATKGDHLPAWLDRTVFGAGHLWVGAKVYDPEGILSTIPALATVLFGVFAGLVVRRDEPLERRILALFVSGTLLAGLGSAWGYVFPINKALWTSSYTVYTAGLAGCGLALCLYACDLRGYGRWFAPFRIYGMNAITVFAGSALVAKTLGMIPIRVDADTSITLRTWIYQNLFESWLDGAVASLAYALTWVFGWLVVLTWMDRRRIYLKV